MADKKLTYQMVSPGDAWNNFVNSKDGHNAAAVTPTYLDSNNLKLEVEKSSSGKPDSSGQSAKPNLFKEAIAHQNTQSQKEQPKEKEEVAMEK